MSTCSRVGLSPLAPSFGGGHERLSKWLSSGVGYEAGPLRIDVTVAHAALAVREEALRHHQVKLVLGPRHGDIKQPALLLDFRHGAGRRRQGMQFGGPPMLGTEIATIVDWVNHGCTD
jgi:hypothetical protein